VPIPLLSVEDRQHEADEGDTSEHKAINAYDDCGHVVFSLLQWRAARPSLVPPAMTCKLINSTPIETPGALPG